MTLCMIERVDKDNSTGLKYTGESDPVLSRTRGRKLSRGTRTEISTYFLTGGGGNLKAQQTALLPNHIKVYGFQSLIFLPNKL